MKFKLTVLGGAGDCARDFHSFERRVAAALEAIDAGPSVYRFELCLELADLHTHQAWYADLRRYIAFRPRARCLMAVCAIDAPALRADTDRAARLARTLTDMASRTRMMKKLPRDFRGDVFRAAVHGLAGTHARNARLEPLEPME
jgi:hypothetical protein